MQEDTSLWPETGQSHVIWPGLVMSAGPYLDVQETILLYWDFQSYSALFLMHTKWKPRALKPVVES